MSTKVRATIDDLYHIAEHGKAEIVDGEVVRMSPTGFMPSRVNSNIYLSLREHEKQDHSGYAIADNTGFIVDLPNRQSFSPDAAWFTGKPTGMKFLEGAPIFAAEVRSENDYGTKAEKKLGRKRADYFAAGTLVVWDVDLLNEEVVKVYKHTDPDNPILYKRGDVAEAEPAVPNWTMAVDELFL